MFRNRTLFFRILTLCLSILLVSVVIIYLAAGTLVRTTEISNIKRKLDKGAQLITDAFSSYYETGTSDEELFSYIRAQAEKKDLSIWIADAFDNVTIQFNYDGNYDRYEQYAKENMNDLSERIHAYQDDYIVYEKQGQFDTPVITVGKAIIKGDRIVGSVYLNAQATGIIGTVASVRLACACAIAVGFIISVVCSLLLARKISRPLYDMNSAAVELAKGNFDQQIRVTDNGEIGQLTETFNQMASALKKYEDTRQSFVGNVSHELKSPLTSIQGFVQGILDGTIPPEEQKNYLDIVLFETKRMNALIMDLLELVKIESDQFPMKMTDWDINELLRRCIITFINKIEDKKIELAVDISENKTLVRGDIDRITQVVTNLMDNAVKFCDEKGTVKIWTYYSGNKVNVNISNTGSIIPEEDIKYIFDRFFKVDKSHNRKIPGTGIGLSIVKEIINRHNEQIWVNSKEGLGTVFTFSLTLADSEESR